MNTASLFSDMLQTITERGRRFLSFGVREDTLDPLAAIEARCETLLSSRGEASGMALAKDILDRWRTFDTEKQREFMRMLLARFGPKTDPLEAAIDAYRASRSPKALLELHVAAEPRRQELVRRLNLAPNGIATLVAMREVLLKLKEEDRDLEAVDADFAHLFGSWFNRGFLVLRPISWSTPADILEKIIRYEAVHHIGGWDELRRRLAPEDRRCFAFFHPRMPDEPLIFVEVALVDGMAGNVQRLLDAKAETSDARQANTAIFYSISNCQQGLAGISFGNFLIKRVAEQLARDLPNIKDFATLSPIPGLRHHIDARLKNEGDGALTQPEIASLVPVTHEAAGAAAVRKLLDRPVWWEVPAINKALRPILTRMAAQFLTGTDEKGRALDRVAHFHLGNGAIVERLNWLGDLSANGLKQSYAMMVNYRYKLGDVDANHEAYSAGRVVASREVRGLAKG